MKTPLDEFEQNIQNIEKLSDIYNHLLSKVGLSNDDISDILRMQYVNTVSALDRFFHEIVKCELLNIFIYKTAPTPKANTFLFKIEFLLKILSPNYSENEKIGMFESEIQKTMGQYSFQNEKSIKDALSYLWNEDQKFQIIAKRMVNFSKEHGNNQDIGKILGQRLTLISQRRNQIVHEADIEFETKKRRNINPQDVINDCALISEFVHAVRDIIDKKN